MSIPAFILCLALGIALGTGVYTYTYGEGFSYLSNDPKACVNCHIMRDHYDGWQKAPHHAVATCNDCHTPHDLVGKYAVKAENGFWHSKAFTLQDYHDPIVIRPKNAVVVQNACVTCHQDLAAAVLGRGNAEDGGAANCVRCHAQVGHGPTK
jgi:cytochrome c nitrite reductase small subunit